MTASGKRNKLDRGADAPRECDCYRNLTFTGMLTAAVWLVVYSTGVGFGALVLWCLFRKFCP